ncbi:MAG: hypothetical protein AB2A00_13340 [Myxococcota bacterium]
MGASSCPASSAAASSTGGAHVWSRDLGGPDGSEAHAVATDGTAMAVAGYYSGTFNPGGGPLVINESGRQTGYVTAHCGDGTFKWGRAFAGSLQTVAQRVVVDSDGGVVVTGYYNDMTDTVTEGAGSSCCWEQGFILSFAADGTMRWQRSYVVPRTNALLGVGVDGENNVYVGGHFYNQVDPGGGMVFSDGTVDVVVAKYSAEGTHLWTRHFGGAGSAYLSGLRVEGDSILLAGNYDQDLTLDSHVLGAGAGAGGGFVAALDHDGNTLWALSVQATNMTVSALAASSLGNVYVAGVFEQALTAGDVSLQASAADGFSYFVLAVDAAGIPSWGTTFVTRTYGGGLIERVSLAADAEGSVFVAAGVAQDVVMGEQTFAVTDPSDVFVASLTSAGTLRWGRVLGGSQQQHAQDLAVNERLYLVGGFNAPMDFGTATLTIPNGSDMHSYAAALER